MTHPRRRAAIRRAASRARTLRGLELDFNDRLMHVIASGVRNH